MPGVFDSVFLVAFDLDEGGHPIRAFRPRLVDTENEALDEARQLAGKHAGVVVWKRVGNPAVGEEGDPEILYQSGRTGDFN